MGEPTLFKPLYGHRPPMFYHGRSKIGLPPRKNFSSPLGDVNNPSVPTTYYRMNFSQSINAKKTVEEQQQKFSSIFPSYQTNELGSKEAIDMQNQNPTLGYQQQKINNLENNDTVPSFSIPVPVSEPINVKSSTSISGNMYIIPEFPSMESLTSSPFPITQQSNPQPNSQPIPVEKSVEYPLVNNSIPSGNSPLFPITQQSIVQVNSQTIPVEKSVENLSINNSHEVSQILGSSPTYGNFDTDAYYREASKFFDISSSPQDNTQQNTQDTAPNFSFITDNVPYSPILPYPSNNPSFQFPDPSLFQEQKFTTFAPDSMVNFAFNFATTIMSSSNLNSNPISDPNTPTYYEPVKNSNTPTYYEPTYSATPIVQSSPVNSPSSSQIHKPFMGTLAKRSAISAQHSIDHFKKIVIDTAEKDTIQKKMKSKDGQITVTDDSIICIFYNKLDLMELNSTILEFMNERTTQTKFTLEEKRNNLLEFISVPRTIVEIKSTQKKLKEIDDKITQLNESHEDFIKTTENSVEIFRTYFSQKTMFDINYKNEESDVKKYRHSIIEEYLYYAKKYVNLNIEREKIDHNNCIGCGFNLHNVQEDINGYKSCPECFVEQENICIQTYQDEENNVGSAMNKEVGYQNKENFLLVLLEFQGIEEFNMPSNMINKLNKYFTSIGEVTYDQAYKLPLNKDGTKPGTNRSLMMTALEKTGFQKYYKNCRKICKIYWGWNLPNITHLIELLMEDYSKTENAFYQVKDDGDERKSCLNAQFRAWKLLNRRGFTCKYSDFKKIETEKILQYHERKWEQICNILNWDAGEAAI